MNGYRRPHFVDARRRALASFVTHLQMARDHLRSARAVAAQHEIAIDVPAEDGLTDAIEACVAEFNKGAP